MPRTINGDLPCGCSPPCDSSITWFDLDIHGVFIPGHLMRELFDETLTIDEVLFLATAQARMAEKGKGLTERETREVFRVLHWTNRKGFAVVKGLKGKGYGK